MALTLPPEILDIMVSEPADDIHDRMLAVIRSYDADTDVQVGSVAWDATRPGAVEMEEIQKQINDGIAAAIPTLSYGPYLEEHVKGQRLERKPGFKATGVVNLSSTVDVTIPAGTVVRDGADRRFTTDTEVVITPPELQPDPDNPAPGVASVGITAEEYGIDYNVSPYTIRFISREFEGLVTVTQEQATTGGIDPESDAELKERYLASVRNQSGAGNPEDYRAWALSVNGVYAAKPIRATPSPGSVTIVIATQTGIPTAELVAEVQREIDEKAGLIANNIVEAASSLTLNLTGTVSYQADADETSVIDAYKRSVNTYLQTLYFAGEPVRYAQLFQLLVTTDGVTDVEGFTVNGGVANLMPGEREVPVLGAVFA